MKIKLTRHAGNRIVQRIKLKDAAKIIKFIFRNEVYIPIGYDLKKEHVKHCLFYIEKLNNFYIACIDENTNEVLTILFGYEFSSWDISTETYNDVRLKYINHSLKYNTNQTFSHIEINVMKNCSEEYLFIKKYLNDKKLIKNKKKSNNSPKPASNIDLFSKKRKSLFQENIEKMRNYNITEEDKELIEKHKKKDYYKSYKHSNKKY